MTTADSEVVRDAVGATQFFRLPFSRQAWRGTQGNWLGVGLGSSIDFQDHRAYTPGDDPRYIHWAAYARTGQLTMKLYRAENAPWVDVFVDVSGSMTFDAAKAARMNQLLLFCVHSADQAGAPVRVHAVNGSHLQLLATDWVQAGCWLEKLPAAPAASPQVMPGALPWRSGALKVLISDLLFPGEPANVLGPLAGGSGLGLVFAPSLAVERDLTLRGNVELHDCESPLRRRQRIDDDLAARYHTAYRRHFAAWDEAARQRGVLLSPVPCEGALKDAFAAEPLRRGLIEHHV